MVKVKLSVIELRFAITLKLSEKNRLKLNKTDSEIYPQNIEIYA